MRSASELVKFKGWWSAPNVNTWSATFDLAASLANSESEKNEPNQTMAGEINSVIHQPGAVEAIAEGGRRADLIVPLVILHLLVKEDEAGGTEIVG